MKGFRVSSIYSALKLSRRAGTFPPRKKLAASMTTAAHPIISTGAKRIDASELFRYSSGRWLTNETQQLSERYVEFDVDELCHLAASLFGDATSCVRVDKMEGSFNKALLLSMNDGNEVIAKLPCPNAGAPHYTTASEVATLEFVRSHTSIPVPKVLAWDSNASNPVGAEYILLEKVQGVPLSGRWDAMSDTERYKLIERLVEAEMELSKISFPAYGNLYFQDSIPEKSLRSPLSLTADKPGLFCVGPSCTRAWRDASLADPKIKGPWTSLEDYAISSLHRDMALQEARGTSKDYLNLLQKLAKLIRSLVSHPRVMRSSKPVLWHTDLHLGNIFVSTNDSTAIQGIIDWQSLVVAPLFQQSRIPAFLKPPKNYVAGAKAPELPENFDQLDEVDKQHALLEKSLAARSKMYEMHTLVKNKEVYIALGLDRRLWEPFYWSRRSSPTEVVPLRNCLLKVSRDWNLLEMPEDCPFTLDGDLEKYEEEKERYNDLLLLQQVVRERIGTDDEGWVPINEWDTAKALNQSLLNDFIEETAKEMSKEEAMLMWPFPLEPGHQK